MPDTLRRNISIRRPRPLCFCQLVSRWRPDYWNGAAAEDGILAALDAIDNLRKEIETRSAEFDEVKKRNGAQLANIKGEMDSVGTKIKIKQGERENVLVRLDAPLVAIYERVRKGKGSGAVVAVKNKACSGCFKTLPPQLVQEIRRAERIITCDSCGRILIWNEEGGS